jgi:hypothetical protein
MTMNTNTTVQENSMTEPGELTAAELNRVYGGIQAQVQGYAYPPMGPEIGAVLEAVKAVFGVVGAIGGVQPIGFHYPTTGVRM